MKPCQSCFSSSRLGSDGLLVSALDEADFCEVAK